MSLIECNRTNIDNTPYGSHFHSTYLSFYTNCLFHFIAVLRNAINKMFT